MWLIYTLFHVFFLALTNYIDEYLTANNKVPESSDIHTRIGGLLLVSTLLTIIGAGVTGVILFATQTAPSFTLIGMLSAIPMVIVFAGYFYLLNSYPAYQVVPLFLMSSVWLLLFEIVGGTPITAAGLIGTLILLLGAYFLDAGTVRWKIPTKLLLLSLPVTFSWAIAVFMIKVASNSTPSMVISFWQLIGITLLGVLLFTFIKKYRDGFMYRIKHQGKNFLGYSLINESFAQGGYVFGNLAIAAAPVASYVTAMSGVQSVFLLLMFLLFPLEKNRAKVARLEMLSIVLIAIGVFLIDK